MISFWSGRFHRQTWHPSFEDLMLYLDGELGSKGVQVGDHTRHCWSCRLRLEKIDRAISEFMEVRNSSFAGSANLPRRASLSFNDKLVRLEAECGHPNLFSDLMLRSTGLFGPQVTARGAIFVALLGLFLVVILRLSLTPPVSASEVLSRARRAEVQQIEQVSSPVIYEKLQLQRSSTGHLDTATWEIWNDTQNKRLRQRVDGNGEGAGHVTTIPMAHLGREARAVGDLAEIFSSHQADLGRPLCASNYETWRSAIPQLSEKVLEGRLPSGDKVAILAAWGRGSVPPDAIVGAETTEGYADWQSPPPEAESAHRQDSPPAKQDSASPEKASARTDVNDGPEPLALTTVAGRHAGDTPPAGESQRYSIIKAELVVRTADWHPVEERLWVNDRKYEIAELDYKVLPLSAVDAAVFAEPPAPVEPVEAPRPVLMETAESLVPPLPDPEETEMAVRYRLHQLDADLGEPIEISRDSQGKVVVDAATVAPELQAKLQEQLACIPNVGLELDRAPSPTCDNCPAPSQETAEMTPSPPPALAPVVNPDEKRLEEIFGDPKAQESFTQEVLSVSGDALSHGFALRNLALRYPAGQEANLSPIAKAQLMEMVNDHLEALGERTSRLQGFLLPFLEALSSGGRPDVESPQVVAKSAPGDEAGASLGVGPKRDLLPDAGSQWQDASFEILAAVRKVDHLAWSLLAKTNDPIPMSQVVPELRQALSEQQKILSRNQNLKEGGLR